MTTGNGNAHLELRVVFGLKEDIRNKVRIPTYVAKNLVIATFDGINCLIMPNSK